ncbi:Homeobox protein onecut [Anthophora plagiata]
MEYLFNYQPNSNSKAIVVYSQWIRMKEDNVRNNYLVYNFRQNESLVGTILLFLNYSHVKETKRPSKEMQVTIARQLGLEPTTVGNFFMNARRRSMDKWKDEDPKTVAVEEGQLSPTIGIGQRQPSDVL